MQSGSRQSQITPAATSASKTLRPPFARRESWQPRRAGVKISGATVHFVIAETDAGPILMQGAVSVSDHDSADTLSLSELFSSSCPDNPSGRTGQACTVS